MGLDCSHDAFHGAYSAFNRLRQFVCTATGGSYPPHWIHGPTGEILKGDDGSTRYHTAIPDTHFQCGDDYPREDWPGLYEFLSHSDCDGEIPPDMCMKVADDLERLLPKLEAMRWESHGHIAARGGFVEVVHKFIDGCRAAAQSGEPLDFH